MELSNDNHRLVTIWYWEERRYWAVSFSFFIQGSWIEAKMKDLWQDEAYEIHKRLKLSKDRPTTIDLPRFCQLLHSINPDHRLFFAIGAMDEHETWVRANLSNNY